jgi:hypothetical protein
MIELNLARYASVTGRLEEAQERLRHAIELDEGIRGLAIEDEDLAHEIRLGPANALPPW